MFSSEARQAQGMRRPEGGIGTRRRLSSARGQTKVLEQRETRVIQRVRGNTRGANASSRGGPPTEGRFEKQGIAVTPRSGRESQGKPSLFSTGLIPGKRGRVGERKGRSRRGKRERRVRWKDVTKKTQNLPLVEGESKRKGKRISWKPVLKRPGQEKKENNEQHEYKKAVQGVECKRAGLASRRINS